MKKSRKLPKSVRLERFKRIVKWKNPFGTTFQEKYEKEKFGGWPVLAIAMIIPIVNIISGLMMIYFLFKKREVYYEKIT